MATYVLVHGGSHGGWCWKHIVPLLRAGGHEVYAPSMTGLGERVHLLRPETNLDTHIADIVNLLEYEDLTKAILVGHSYGGMVITGVADRALARVGHLVYLDAAHPGNGESLVDLTPAIMEATRQTLRVVDGVELVMFPQPEAGRHYGVQDAKNLAWMQTRLLPHPWKSFTQPLRLSNEAAVMRLPRTSINCTETLGRRPPERLQRALTADNVWEIDTGHDLMITEPRAVADMLLKLARG